MKKTGKSGRAWTNWEYDQAVNYNEWFDWHRAHGVEHPTLQREPVSRRRHGPTERFYKTAADGTVTRTTYSQLKKEWAAYKPE